MSRNDCLRRFRPRFAAERAAACDSPAIPLSGLNVHKALFPHGIQLYTFEVSSPHLLAKGLLRAAMQLDAVVSLSCRPPRAPSALSLSAFANAVFQTAAAMGFRHPLVLSAGPFEVGDSPSESDIHALLTTVASAISSGFTDVSLSVSENPSSTAVSVVRAAIGMLHGQKMAAEVVCPSGESASKWLAALPAMSGKMVISVPDADWQPGVPALIGLRPPTGEFPDTGSEGENGEIAPFRKFPRLTGDPLSEIALQVLDEETAAAVQAETDAGTRLTDALASAVGDASDVSPESLLWAEQNVYFFALDLLRSAGVKGSAAKVRHFFAPNVPDTDPEDELDQLLSELRGPTQGTSDAP